MSKHYRPGVREQSIGGHVVEVIVGVDHEFHRKLGDLPNRGKELLTVLGGEITIGIDGGRCVDDDDPIITDDESCVGRPIGNRHPNIPAGLFQRKERFSNVLSAGLTAEVEKKNARKQQEPQGSVRTLLDGRLCRTFADKRRAEVQASVHGTAPFASGQLPADASSLNSKGIPVHGR